MRRVYKFVVISGVLGGVLAGCGADILGLRSEEGCDGATAMYLSSVAPGEVDQQIATMVPTVETYASCQALQDAMRQDWRTHAVYTQNYYDDGGSYQRAWTGVSSGKQSGCAKSAAKGGIESATSTAQASVPQADKGTAETFTNTQEKGVDEADTVKVADHHLYVRRGDEIQVVARQSLTALGAIPLAGLHEVSMQTDGDRLIVVGKKDNATTIRIMDAAEGALPTLAKEHVLTGNAYDSRFVGGYLVLVFRDTLPWNDFIEGSDAAPLKVEGDAVGGIPCDRIVKPAARDRDTRFNKIVSIDTRKLDTAPQSVATIGGGDQIYMTESALYVTKMGGYSYRGDEKLLVTKIAFNATTGVVAPAAAGLIGGRVKDQWAFKEYAVDEATKVLSVATSTGYLGGQGASLAQNHIWVLRQNDTALEVAAAVHDFGTGEDIRSVRYVNDIAYVVTFKKTDPLFAFDMKNPLDPKLLGELKVPGFSVYMHPVAEGRILGVGFDAEDQGDFAWYQGLQVSLFDVSNPLDMKRVDNKIIGQRGSYSDVTGDHHAFFFDQERKLIGIPAVELGGKTSGGGPELGTTLAFSGAIIYRLDEAAITEAGRLSHADLLPEACKYELAAGRWWQEKTVSLDINRIFMVDGKLLTVSRFGVRAWDPARLDQPAVASIAFVGAAGLCGLRGAAASQ